MVKVIELTDAEVNSKCEGATSTEQQQLQQNQSATPQTSPNETESANKEQSEKHVEAGDREASEPFLLLPDETLIQADSNCDNTTLIEENLEPGDLDLVSEQSEEAKTMDKEQNEKEREHEMFTTVRNAHCNSDTPNLEKCATNPDQTDNAKMGLYKGYIDSSVSDLSTTGLESECKGVDLISTGETSSDSLPPISLGVESRPQKPGVETAQHNETQNVPTTIEDKSKQYAESGVGEAKTQNKTMEISEIQNVLDRLNADIHSIKERVDSNPAVPASSTEPDNFTDQFKAIRIRNDALRQELISIKHAQDQRRPVDTSKFTEQKLIENSKLLKLKDSTCDLQKEIEIISKARKAQDRLKQAQLERQRQVKEAAKKKVKECLAAESRPVEVEQIRQQISTLKDEMDQIINAPISEIVADEESSQQENNKEKPVNKNKKAHDDMMKKYLMMQVMRNNLKQLTGKMNEIMAAQGLTPVNSAQTSENTASAPAVESDEFYMHEDEGNASDLYEEDEEENIALVKESAEKSEKSKSSLVESVAKSIATVESVIYKDKAKQEEVTHLDTSGNKKNQKAAQHAQGGGRNSNRNKRGKRGGKAPPENVLASIRTQQEMKKKEEAAKVQTKQNTNETMEQSEKDVFTMPTSKIGTYNFLLKLQREMAVMQIQMTKMQEGLRSANNTLQMILESEFVDME